MQVRTQTLVKGAIIQIAADPFAQVRSPTMSRDRRAVPTFPGSPNALIRRREAVQRVLPRAADLA
jgi:ribosomal protein S8E